MTIDGLNVGNPPGGNQPPAYVGELSVDLYNALNTGAILTYNNTYAPPTATAPSVYQQPLTVATPLMVRFTAEFSF